MDARRAPMFGVTIVTNLEITNSGSSTENYIRFYQVLNSHNSIVPKYVRINLDYN